MGMTNEEIFQKRLKEEYDADVRRYASKIPGFIEDCMELAIQQRESNNR